jgi:hypothetical protein
MSIKLSSKAAFNAENEAIPNGSNDLQSDLSETSEPFEMFKKGDKVRVAHNDRYDYDYLGCRHHRPFLCCEREQQEYVYFVGAFAKVQRVFGPELTLYFDDDGSYRRCSSTDCINYSLLGDQVANKLYEDTKDRDFDWTFIVKGRDSILNREMIDNMELIEPNEKHIIETTANIFRDQIHAFHHRMLGHQLELNRFLRNSTHYAIAFAKKNTVVMGQD